MILSSISLVCSGQTAEDEALVKKVIITFEQDFNEGSFKNAASYTTTDWQHINPGGGITKGREQVLKEVRGVHQTFLKGVSMHIEKMNIRFITSDVAVGDVVHQLSPYELPKGVKHEKERQLKTYVVVRKQGKWLLIHDQNTIIQE
jgi:uncharacterized protein (TIGR02246 family)